MKIEQISEHIWTLKSWMGIPVRVWMVVDEEGVTLVDAGFSFMAKGILRFIEGLNAGPLQRILLTHGHSDHVGSIKAILDRHTAPVYAHRIEIPYMEGDILYPRRKKLEFNVAKGLALPFDEEHEVAGLNMYHTPGHSPGHVVFYHERDGVLLAGDLFTSKKGKLRKPMAMFTADMDEAVRSSRIVSQLNPQRLEVCHGGPVFQPAAQVDAYLRNSR